MAVPLDSSDVKDSTMDADRSCRQWEIPVSLQVGEQVIAIGNALGYGQSVTSGIVSATGAEILTWTVMKEVL